MNEYLSPPPQHKQSLDFPNRVWEVLLTSDTVQFTILVRWVGLSPVTTPGPCCTGRGCLIALEQHLLLLLSSLHGQKHRLPGLWGSHLCPAQGPCPSASKIGRKMMPFNHCNLLAPPCLSLLYLVKQPLRGKLVCKLCTVLSLGGHHGHRAINRCGIA